MTVARRVHVAVALACALTLGLLVVPAGAQQDQSFTVGWSVPTGQNPWINTIQESAEKVIEKAGGTLESRDAQLDPGKAVSALNEFISAGDDAVVVAPAQVGQAVLNPLSDALSKDIGTFALEWSFVTDDPSAPPETPVQGQSSIDRQALGEQVAAQVNKDLKGDAKIMYVGLPFPVASLDFFEESMQAALEGTGSEIVANLDNPTDNADGALPVITNGLTADPEVNAIVTYNGPSAVAAVQAVRAAGKTGDIKIYNIQIDPATADALAEGDLAAAWDIPPRKLGKGLAKLIVAQAQGKPESEWAKTVVVDPVKYTTKNVAKWTKCCEYGS